MRLLVQTLRDFLAVAFVVQFEQAIEDFLTSGRTDGESKPLLHFVIPVAEPQIIPFV